MGLPLYTHFFLFHFGHGEGRVLVGVPHPVQCVRRKNFYAFLIYGPSTNKLSTLSTVYWKCIGRRTEKLPRGKEVGKYESQSQRFPSAIWAVMLMIMVGNRGNSCKVVAEILNQKMEMGHLGPSTCGSHMQQPRGPKNKMWIRVRSALAVLAIKSSYNADTRTWLRRKKKWYKLGARQKKKGLGQVTWHFSQHNGYLPVAHFLLFSVGFVRLAGPTVRILDGPQPS